MRFSSIWPIYWTLSGATTLSQSGPVSNSNEGVLRIPRSSNITGTSPSDCLVSYPGHPLGGILILFREAVSVFYRLSRLGKCSYFTKIFSPLNSLIGWLVLKNVNLVWVFITKVGLVSGNYSYFQIIVILCFYTIIWLQVFQGKLTDTIIPGQNGIEPDSNVVMIPNFSEFVILFEY